MGSGKILVIRGGAIGDFILTLPAIAALRAQFPNAHLEVLGYPHIARLAVDGGLANRAHFIEARALAAFFARGGDLAEEMVDFFSEFDVIVSYLYDPDAIFQTNVRRCTAAQFIAGPHRPDERAGIHAAKVFLQPLERLAIFEASAVPCLDFKPLPASPDQPWLALLPGSGSEEKNWPEANWGTLIAGLAVAASLRFLLVGGEAEGDRLERLATALPANRVRVARSLPLPDLGALLQGCVGFIGHDSGISHLAAAVGLPGIVLWGHTAEEIWRPPSDKVIILRPPEGLAGLSVQAVLDRVPHMRAATNLTHAHP